MAIDVGKEKPLSFSAAAKLLGVSPNTIRRWADVGVAGRKLEAVRKPAGYGRFRRTSAEALNRFLDHTGGDDEWQRQCNQGEDARRRLAEIGLSSKPV